MLIYMKAFKLRYIVLRHVTLTVRLLVDYVRSATSRSVTNVRLFTMCQAVMYVMVVYVALCYVAYTRYVTLYILFAYALLCSLALRLHLHQISVRLSLLYVQGLFTFHYLT